MRAAYWVWRRELHVMLRAPILYVVGGVFLVVQGVAFAGLVGALSDPRKPAPLGALLEGQLAGTLLTWVLSLVVLTLLGMRTIAEDKRSGAWELLLTAQVGEGAAVVGKWLAASTLYAILWLPTLAYLGVVAIFRADDGGWDVAAIACGYAGAIAIGAALLAAAVFMLMRQLSLFPPGSEEIGVRGLKLALAIGGNFMLGALMTLGIGLYAPCMILVSLLGMSERTAFPIMMGSCAFLMPIGSLRFIREKSYSLRAALGLAIGGVPGVLLAAYIVKSLDLRTVRWLVIVVVLYTAVTLLMAGLRSQSSQSEDIAESRV